MQKPWLMTMNGVEMGRIQCSPHRHLDAGMQGGGGGGVGLFELRTEENTQWCFKVFIHIFHRTTFLSGGGWCGWRGGHAKSHFKFPLTNINCDSVNQQNCALKHYHFAFNCQKHHHRNYSSNKTNMAYTLKTFSNGKTMFKDYGFRMLSADHGLNFILANMCQTTLIKPKSVF